MSVAWIQVHTRYKAGDEVFCAVDDTGFGFRRKYVRRVYVETEVENLEDTARQESCVYYAVSDFPHGDFDPIDRMPEDHLHTREQALDHLEKLVRHRAGPVPQSPAPGDNVNGHPEDASFWTESASTEEDTQLEGILLLLHPPRREARRRTIDTRHPCGEERA
ncbi:MAG: hypothetical protein GX443_19130 [Deltaproteobacteria bacterium]|nr:hypothetical protein [Deltaproteobacteria bacterium]